MLCIIDYGSGNIAAIANICNRERIPFFIGDNPESLSGASHFLLPGVGAFDPTMSTLNETGFLHELENQVINQGKPILGICVGMHLLSNGSDEGNLSGLGWIPGHVRKIDSKRLNKVPHLPHMGWNALSVEHEDALLREIDLDKGFYFLHSYFFDASDQKHVTATTCYGQKLPCIVRNENIIGAQFHPEKSHQNGIRFLKNFMDLM